MGNQGVRPPQFVLQVVQRTALVQPGDQRSNLRCEMFAFDGGGVQQAQVRW